VAAAARAQPVSWRYVAAGHTHAQKWVVTLADGRTVFVKAGTQASARRQIERERAVIGAVRAPFMPSVFDGAVDEAWSTIVLEDLSDAQWPPPYVDDGAALLEAVARLGGTRPPAGLSRRPSGRPLGTYWERIAAAPEPVLAGGSFSAAWLEHCLPELIDAESRARLDGDDFLHDDVWHGNVCYADRGAVLIDWASASVGDRRLDLAYALLSIRASGATPPSVDFDDEARTLPCSPARTPTTRRSQSTIRSCARQCCERGGCTICSTPWSGLPTSSGCRGRSRSDDGVEPTGLEPVPYALPAHRSPN
jgi:Phosphotransferase enzyme family